MAKTSELLEGHIRTAEKFAEYQKKSYEAYKTSNAPALMLNLIKLETLGGKCPECGKPWKKVEVKNQCADFAYFTPDCKCYPHCPACGVSFHREWAMGIRDFTHCKSCGSTSTPIYGRKCDKCGHWFVTDNPAWGKGVRCEDCSKSRERSGKGDKINLEDLISSVVRKVREEDVA